MFASSLACGRAISRGRPRRGGWRDEHAAEVRIGRRRTAEGAEGREPGVSAVPCPPLEQSMELGQIKEEEDQDGLEMDKLGPMIASSNECWWCSSGRDSWGE